jgi:hypothetical protein
VVLTDSAVLWWEYLGPASQPNNDAKAEVLAVIVRDISEMVGTACNFNCTSICVMQFWLDVVEVFGRTSKQLEIFNLLC